MEIFNSWIALALLGPLFWTLSDFIDKLVIDAHTKGIFDFLFSFSLTSWLCLLLLILWFGIPSFSSHGAIAIGLGFATTTSFYFYARGLQYTDTSLAILTFKLVPILAILFAWLFFSATIELRELLAASIVLGGAGYLFLNIEGGRLKISKGLSWILLAVAMWAVIFVLADHILKSIPFSEYMVFDTLGASLVTLPLLLMPNARREIHAGIRSATPAKYGWFFLNTFSDFLAQVCLKKAFSLAPTVGIVSVVTQIQSIYGILTGILLTLLFPRVISEDISPRNLLRKLTGTLIIVFGIYIALIK
ncbi:EamA family transporter [Aliamphritea ceti]|uniref:EamA family transporter n=1 Tax=Aliamphritea ceti TaxID=1524258 RepID=UPI0021C3128C|nr:DMT family transporter [Aliamphritea ceti]